MKPSSTREKSNREIFLFLCTRKTATKLSAQRISLSVPARTIFPPPEKKASRTETRPDQPQDFGNTHSRHWNKEQYRCSRFIYSRIFRVKSFDSFEKASVDRFGLHSHLQE